jgi:hypothetical protein
MAANLADIVKLAEELSDGQKAILAVWLLDKINTDTLTVQERLAVFNSMTVDLGGISPEYLDKREDY